MEKAESKTRINKKLLLVDGHSMAFRAFYAIPDTFSNSKGVPTNAVYGFFSILSGVMDKYKPTHIAVAFDISRVSFRTQMLPTYKGTRGETPESFIPQVPIIKRMLDALNIKWFEKENYEADDILATLATKGEDNGFKVYVCSGDRDTFQLISENITVLYPGGRSSQLKEMDAAAVLEKYSVMPYQYPEIAALTGEVSDNIPGVPKVGEKTAAKWLSEYGSLDNLLKNASDIKGVVGQNLRDNIDRVIENRKINALVTDLQIDGFSFYDIAMREINSPAFEAIIQELSFANTTAIKLKKAFSLGTGTSAGFGESGGFGKSEESQKTAHDDKPHENDVNAHFSPPTKNDLSAVLENANANDKELLLLPTETSFQKQIVLSTQNIYTVLDVPEDPNDPKNDTVNQILRLFDTYHIFTNDLKKCCHYLDNFTLNTNGVPPLDISLAGYLANPDLKDYSIGNLADYFLKVVVPKREKPKQTSLFEDSQDDEKDDVLEKELRAAFMLKGFFDEKFDLTSRDESANTAPDSADSKLHDSADSMSHSFTQTIATVNDDKVLLNDIELPIACLLASMEKTGILADRGVLGSISGALAEKVADAAENAMACLDNQSVNLNSPKQLQKVLFEDLGMPRTKKTKTGYTTNQEALEQLFVQTRHPFLQNLLAFRESTKQKQIVDGFLESVRMDGKIHTTYQQTGAATGRLSSKEPNLQNVPAKTEDSAKVRAAFVASQGYDFLISADYSQIEMRIMAHLSGDAGLIEAFKNNEDLHAFVAAQVFGVPLNAVTKEERRKVKAVSYGLSYGLSSFGLSQQLKISVSEASHIIDKYYERFGGVRDYLQSVVKFARMDGWTSTILGRKRYFDGFSSHNRMVQQATERAALNSPIQGSAADIIKIAMLEVSKAFREAGLKSRILLQVHDELIIETTADELDTARQILVDKMERSPRIKDLGLKVPLRVSVGVGKNWLEAAH